MQWFEFLRIYLGLISWEVLCGNLRKTNHLYKLTHQSQSHRDVTFWEWGRMWQDGIDTDYDSPCQSRDRNRYRHCMPEAGLFRRVGAIFRMGGADSQSGGRRRSRGYDVIALASDWRTYKWRHNDVINDVTWLERIKQGAHVNSNQCTGDLWSNNTVIPQVGSLHLSWF